MKRTLLLLAVGLALASSGLFTSGAPPATERVVGADWLQANLDRPEIRIVDMRGDIRDFWEGHIPGAVFLDSAALRWPDRGVPSKLMPTAALALLLGEMGVRKNTQIVVYSEVNHYRATYFMWALDVLGHPNWVLLEGGFERWKKESRPVTQDYPALKPVVYAAGRQPTPASGRHSPMCATGIPRRPSRRPASYIYAREKGSQRKRHQGRHQLWALDVDETGAWRPADELRRAYEAIGVTPDKTVIVSCGQGQMSSHVYFTLKYVLGFPRVKNYDGSFNEWSAVASLPVETGK
jgi:thiosulfate/3-mercaptopyruvate sulfurtransferase